MALENFNYTDFPELSISCINCNSLNMSVSSKHNQIRKIYGITKLKTDIILLSDIRLCNRNLVSASNDCSKTFRTNPYGSYKFLFQSFRNKRGVGILIINDISFLEEAREADPEDNFLLLRASIKGSKMILGAVYGPNDYNPQFFFYLKNAIDRLGNWPILIGGDRNCTFSADPIINNIDCLNMADPPNIRHSRLLLVLCTDLGLTDPYRLFFPGRKDFSFIPRSQAQLNKSRIDFFLINIPFFNAVSECDISTALQNSLFDHKSVFITLNAMKQKELCNPTIAKDLINKDELSIVVKLAAAEG